MQYFCMFWLLRDQVSPRDPILEKDMIPENNQIPFEGSDSLEDPDLSFKDPIQESCKESGFQHYFIRVW